MKGVVVNRKGLAWKGEYVYVGRGWGENGGYFGNPFVIGKDGNRDEVIRKFERWSRERGKVDLVYRERVKGLYGKTLVCWCKPLHCHGDVLIKLGVEWMLEDVEVE